MNRILFVLFQALLGLSAFLIVIGLRQLHAGLDLIVIGLFLANVAATGLGIYEDTEPEDKVE